MQKGLGEGQDWRPELEQPVPGGTGHVESRGHTLLDLQSHGAQFLESQHLKVRPNFRKLHIQHIIDRQGN